MGEFMNTNYIISLDLDETLLKSDTTLSAYTIKVINQLIDQGIHVIANTARSHTIIPDAVSKIHFKHYICSNGATIYDVAKKEVIFTHKIKDETVKDILDRTKDLQLSATIATTKGLYSTPIFKDRFTNTQLPKEKVAEILNSRSYVNDLLELLAYPEDIQKVQFNFRNNEKALYLHHFENIANVSITSSHDNNLEITNENASKGKTIHTYAQLFNIEDPYIIAYGDDLNDLAQMEYADRFTAMKNGHPEVLAQATLISEFSNEEDGVAKDLADYFKL